MSESAKESKPTPLGVRLIFCGVVLGAIGWILAILVTYGARYGWANWGTFLSDLMRLGKYAFSAVGGIMMVAGAFERS